jgi:hypothetical protein
MTTARLLLGFDRQRRERRKAELRARLAKEFAMRTQTVQSREQIEAENLIYWTCGGISYLRRKYMIKAEQSREQWAKLDPQGPHGVRHKRSEAKDSGGPKCEVPDRKDPMSGAKDDVFDAKNTGANCDLNDGAEAPPQKPSQNSYTDTVAKCDMSEGKDTWGPKCDMSGAKDISTESKCDTNIGEIRRCRICGKSFRSTRPDAALCSASCRKRASRNRTVQLLLL